MRTLVALIASAICLTAVAQESPRVSSIRDSQYEWQCETSNGDLISGHTRQDKANESCFNQALANPGTVYIVRAGTYRISATVPDAPPPPPPDPPVDPDPDPPVDPPPDPGPDDPLVTFGPVTSLTEYPSMVSMQRDSFRWAITFTANSLVNKQAGVARSATQAGLASRDQYGQNQKGHLTVYVEDEGTGDHRVHVRNQDIDGGGPTTVLTGTTQIVPGQQYQVVVSLDEGTGIGLFVDGQLEDSSTVAYGLADNDLGLVVGGSCSQCDDAPDAPPDRIPGRAIDGTTYMEIWAEPLELPAPVSSTLQWQAPTHYEDCDPDAPAENCGEPIGPGELTDFNIYLTQPEDELLRTVAGDVSSYEYVTTRDGLHCFEVTAVAGLESDRSDEACREL